MSDELESQMQSALEDVYEALLEADEARLIEIAPVNDLIH